MNFRRSILIFEKGDIGCMVTRQSSALEINENDT